MTSLTSLLSIARDGILANAGALSVTGQNVAGASTPGYVKRTAVLENRRTGGVEMTGIQRSFDRFAQARLLDQEGRLAFANSRAGVLSEVEAAVSPVSNNLLERAGALFSSFQELARSPSDLAARSSVLARASALATGFSEAAGSLDGLRDTLFVQARDVVSEVNVRLERLEKLDKDIVITSATGGAVSELRDQRDQTIREITERIGGTFLEGGDSSVVFSAAGVVLYEAGTTAKLEVSMDVSGAVRIDANRGGKVDDITRGLDTGTLGGILEARDRDVPRVSADLDELAFETASMLNALHASGAGLDGVSGRPLFTPIGTVTGAAHALGLDGALVDHPERIAAAATAADLPGGNSVAARIALAASEVLSGGGTFPERFASIASSVGLMRQTADGEVAMREDTVMTATSLRESASGVSTDEEMVQLQQFQRGFEASTRILRVVDELFDTLMRSI